MKIRTRRNPGGSKSYQLDLGVIVLPDGSKKRDMRSFKVKKDAEIQLEAIKERRRLHGDSSLALPEATRLRYSAAEARLAALGVSVEQAVDFYARNHQGIKERLTVRELVNRCLLIKKLANLRPRYLHQLKCSAMSFVNTPGVGDRAAADVTSDDVSAWLNGNAWAPKTRSVYLGDLRTVFAWAIQQRLALNNPCAAVAAPELDDKPPEIFSVNTCVLLLAAALHTDADAQMLGYVAVGLFAGIRPEERARLAWEDIHLDERFIEVSAAKSKTRRRRIVEISENLAAWLAVAARPKNKRLSPANPGKLLREVVRKAGEIRNWPHDVERHSFASYHLAAHGSADKTALQLGHHNTQMLFAHYRELVRPKEAEAYWRISPVAMRDSIAMTAEAMRNPPKTIARKVTT